MAKKREELLNYKMITSKVYRLCTIAVISSVTGELFKIIASAEYKAIIYAVFYAVYGICSFNLYRIFDRYEGKLFFKFRVYTLIAMLTSLILITVVFIYPDLLMGDVITKGANYIPIPVATAVFTSAILVIPMVEFYEIDKLTSSSRSFTNYSENYEQ